MDEKVKQVGSTMTEPQNKKEVPRAMSYVDKRIDALFEITEKMESQLAMVLSPSKPKEATSNDREGFNSEAANVIMGKAEKLEIISSRLSDIIDRLEV